MKFTRIFIVAVFVGMGFVFASTAHAQLSLTSGNNATTTPNVATSITGFQIVGNAASTTPVKLFSTSGTLAMSVTTGLTFTGNSSGTVIYFSGTVADINAALSTLTYSRSSTGSDTLEVSLVNPGEVFYEGTGHLYAYVSDTTTWNQAKTQAEALTLYGASGYLTTITSSGENAFVAARLANAGWMGASDSAVEGTWKWVTGPETGTTFWSGVSTGSTVGGNYANWGSGEPNQSGDEDCGQFLSGGTGKWNDLPCNTTTLPGYVVEYGAPGNLPSVVAKNISVVTADVPAITSLSPSNASTSVSTSANLVIGFSKIVTKNTGAILIKKYSDDSTVESIDVSGNLITGSGTNSITINPASTLEEGTQYYVTIPNTAFKDSSNNFFDSISAKTTWSFTTSDITAPVISNVTAQTIATTTATVAWDTNEAASSKLVYSIDSVFASTTQETDISPRVLSHTASLSNLLACTTYNYKVVSGDAFSNRATSTAAAFITKGCTVNVEPLSATTTSISVNTTSSSTLTENGRSLIITTPPHFTATSSTVVIQIKSIESDPVVTTLGVPGSLFSASQVAFDVTALVNSSVVLDSFDTPVTISYKYTDEDITGLDESTLTMHHYHNGSWLALSNCSVNTSANEITCSTPSFSIFAIFGNRVVASSAGAQSAGGYYAPLVAQITQSSYLTSTRATNALVRDLELSMSGDDVLMLQKLLNARGFLLATSGVGSIGNETPYFGTLTKNALIRYQKKYMIVPSVGYFGPKTRAHMKNLSSENTWW